MSRLSAIVPALLLPLLAAGCFPRPDYRDLPNASVIKTSVEVVQSVAVADNSAPTAEESAAIAAAQAKAGERGLRVKLRLPQGQPVPEGTELRRRIGALGIDPSVAVVEPNAVAGHTEVVFLRVTATAPDCAAMVTPSEEISAWMRPSMAFGCATYTNLTTIVADPADLAAGRGFAGGDAAASAAAIGRYHQNQVTPLRNTSSSSATSSGGTQ